MKSQMLARTVFGTAIIALGVGFLLDTLNIADFSNLVNHGWPVLVILAGFLSLLNNPKMFVWPLAVMAAGILLLLNANGVINVNVWQLLWPAAIIIFGISVLFNRQHSPTEQSAHSRLDRQATDRQVDEIFAIFSGAESHNTNQKYRGGRVTAIFGGVDLDLRNAKLTEDANIEVFAAFGGVTIRVPDAWQVRANGLPLFGGWDNKARKPESSSSPLLTVHGTALFGGVEIKN